MSKIVLSSILGGLLAFSCINAAEPFLGPTKFHMKVFDDLTVHGPTNLILVKAETLNIKGTLNFSELDVAKTADLIGPVKGTKGKFETLKVNGPLEITYVICNDMKVLGSVAASYLEVKNDADITGTIKAIHSKFFNLTITGEEASLSNSTVNNITFKEDPKSKEQILLLRGQTSVTGTITFDSGKGIVRIDGDQVEIKGAVKGGTTEKAKLYP